MVRPAAGTSQAQGTESCIVLADRVGAGLWRARMPLSADSMFRPRKGPKNPRQPTRDLLTRLREQLLAGDLAGAHQGLDALQTDGVTMYEYLADLHLCFLDARAPRGRDLGWCPRVPEGALMIIPGSWTWRMG
jgi:hypothetical protein